MPNNPDTVLFDYPDSLVFAEDTVVYEKASTTKWKLMIVDDEQDVHTVTKMALKKFEFEGKPLEFIHAYSASDAMHLISEHPDTALILLDVVMEYDDAGLQVVKYIREELKNTLVRIILRTGQPGQAPEERVISNYDINDYKEKTELTSQKLFTTVAASLRSYRDLITIDTNRKVLRRIIDSFADIIGLQSVREFASSVLAKLTSIFNLNASIPETHTSSFASIKHDRDFHILAATGDFSRDVDKRIQDVVDNTILKELENAHKNKRNIYLSDYIVIYLQSRSGSEILIYFKGMIDLETLDENLIDIFCSNVSAVNEAIINSTRYESERRQHIFSETLGELSKKLTSTLDLKTVLVRLLASLAQVLDYDRALAVLKEDEAFEVFAEIEDQVLKKDSDLQIGAFEYAIISKVASMGTPLLIPDVRSVTQAFGNSAQEKAKSILAVPVIYKGKISGIVMLQNSAPNAFNTGDSDTAFTFASQAGIAIENAWLFNEVNYKNTAVNNLLNNAGQGFLTFGKDLVINEEYSVECIRIFNGRIENKKFSHLLYNDLEQIKSLESILLKVLQESDEINRNLYIPLLPDEVTIGGKYISAKYKIIESSIDEGGKACMVILTDITDTRSLENKMEEERKILKMVVKSVTSSNDFMWCINDYKKFCGSGLHEILVSSQPVEEIIFEIFRSIHTFKGNFSSMEMVHIVPKLHGLETAISQKMTSRESITLEDFKAFILQYDILSWIDEDIDVLKSILGEGFVIRKNVLTLDEEQFMQFEQQMVSLLPDDECKQLLPSFNQLRYKPFAELLKSYPDYIARLSERLGKTVHPLLIEGGTFLVDTGKYYEFSKSLVNVFKNAVDHGIEPIEDRIEKCKDGYGSIKCSVSRENRKITLTISDDGRGIDVKKLRSIAVTQKIYNMETAQGASDSEVMQLVFRDGLTTRMDVTEFAGRGFGLAAIYNETKKMGGMVEIHSTIGAGTWFKFIIPELE